MSAPNAAIKGYEQLAKYLDEEHMISLEILTAPRFNVQLLYAVKVPTTEPDGTMTVLPPTTWDRFLITARERYKPSGPPAPVTPVPITPPLVEKKRRKFSDDDSIPIDSADVRQPATAGKSNRHVSPSQDEARDEPVRQSLSAQAQRGTAAKREECPSPGR